MWLNDEPSWYYLTYPDLDLQQQQQQRQPAALRAHRYRSMEEDYGASQGFSPTNSPSASRLSGDSILLDDMEGIDRWPPLIDEAVLSTVTLTRAADLVGLTSPLPPFEERA